MSEPWQKSMAELAAQYNDKIARDRATLAMRGKSARVFDAVKIESGPLFGELGTQLHIIPEEDK